jgi:hypothetical protein
MPQCPQCSKPLRELVRRCPSCQADLDLLVDYVSHLQGGLDRAESLTRAGELGQAVWAYLEILEVDPDNAAAKKQVGQVATAVRQFDLAAPGRKWANQGRDATGPPRQMLALLSLAAAVLMVVAFSFGYMLGSFSGGTPADDKDKPAPPQLGQPTKNLS